MKTKCTRWKKNIFSRLCFLLVLVLVYEIHMNGTMSWKKDANISNSENTTNNNILCMVLTSEKTILTRGIAVWETYGKQFNNIIFACNCPRIMKVKALIENNDVISDDLKMFINAAKLPLLHLNVVENNNKMGVKVLEVLKQSYNIYKGKTNWFFMIDDDGYVFVDNLYKFIQSKDTNEPKLYGFKFMHTKKLIKGGMMGHIAGGPGIVITNESMRLLYDKISSDECKNTTIYAYGDVAIALCGLLGNISIGDSRDSFGKQRFHNYSPLVHFYGPLPSILTIHGHHDKKIGRECCSLETISFHYVNSSEMYKIHANKTFLKDLLL